MSRVLPVGAREAEQVEALEQRVAALQGQCRDYQELLARPDQRKLLSLYKLVAGMAECKYRFKVSAARNEATSAVRADLQKVGLDLDEGTILKILRDATRLSRGAGSDQETD